MRWRVMYVEMAHAFGGSIVSLYQLLRGLDMERYEPVVVFYHPNPYIPRFEALGARVHVLKSDTTAAPARRAGKAVPAHATQRPLPGRRAAAAFLALLQQIGPGTARLLHLIRREQVDLVHLNDVIISNREGILAAMLAGVPCISHVRAFETLTALDRRLAWHVDAFIYISGAIARAHEQQGVPAARGTVIFNALDLDEFRPRQDRAVTRAQLGLAQDDEVVGLVARMVAWKGHTVFLDAISQLSRERPRLRAVIAGDADATEPDYVGHLRDMAERLGIADRVLFAGYWEDIATLLPALDLLVHCSLKPEPFGRVIIEGMAAGVPVIGAADGAVPEIISHGETGWLVPPNDAGGLAAAIAYLLEHPAHAREMSRRAQEHVREHFSLEAHAAQVQHIYEEVLNSAYGAE